MSDENKADVIRRFYAEVMGKGNVDVLDELMVKDFVDHGDTLFGSPQGRDTLKQGITGMHTIFSNFDVLLEDIIVSGDMVGVRGTMRCQHTNGTWLGAEGSGNNLEWKGLAMFRLEDGKIAERWFNSDGLSVVQQLGVVTL
jgi:predicted ester cyclase